MKITHKKVPFQHQYTANNIRLQEVENYKYLGLWISNKLSWTKHIDNITARSLRKLLFLRRSLKLSTPNVRLLAYNAIIRPIIEYAVVIWDPFTKSDINKLERLQKKAARFIYNSYGRTSISVLEQSGMLPVSVRDLPAKVLLSIN